MIEVFSLYVVDMAEPASLEQILEPMERVANLVYGNLSGHARGMAVAAISLWAEHLVTGQVKVRKPKVLHAGFGYGKEVCQEVGDSVVVIDVEIVSRVAKTKIKGLQCFTGHMPNLGLHYKNVPPEAIRPLDPLWRDRVAGHVERLRSSVLLATSAMRASAPEIAASHRRKSAPKSESLVVQRLAPVMVKTGLVNLSPGSLCEVLHLSPSDLKKLSGFMKRNRAHCSSATAEVCASAIAQAKVMEVMDG